MKLERTPTGLVELHLSDDPEQFDCLAEWVRADLRGRWAEQLNGLDQSYWDLDVQAKVLTVHREHDLGVSVFCKDDKELIALLDQLKNEFEAQPAVHAMTK
ncbi:MAG: hypothetical protein NTX50_23225 [Candidatus Sumerlaeota bacterium]|nr:hypothetical protein [Candidatus Sumerlaeota bacterium]